jgi:hypothetical protein
MGPEGVTFDLELRDYRAMAAFVCAPARTHSKWVLWVIVPFLTFLTVGIALLFVQSVLSFVGGMLAVLFLFWIAIKVLVPRAQRRLEPSAHGTILCEYKVTLSDQGVDIRTPHWDTLTRWSGIVSVDETPEHVFLKIDAAAAYAVPVRAFADDDARRRFLSLAKAYLPVRERAA